MTMEPYIPTGFLRGVRLNAACLLVLCTTSCTFVFPVIPGLNGNRNDNSVQNSNSPDGNESSNDNSIGCECGGIAGFACDDGFFCMLPTGSCDSADLCGTCEMAKVCPEIYDPVCGCDGLTYSSECFAIMAGVNVDHVGECGT